MATGKIMSGFRKSAWHRDLWRQPCSAQSGSWCAARRRPGNAWEGVCIVLVFVMLASMFGALGLVAAMYIKFRSELVRTAGGRRFRTRNSPPCSQSSGESIRNWSVGFALWQLLLSIIGGDRFYPEDRLDEDLHWLDVAPFACERFCAGLEESVGLENEEIHTRVARRQLTTFGDVILVASSLASQSKEGVPTADPKRSDPVWDRALDR